MFFSTIKRGMGALGPAGAEPCEAVGRAFRAERKAAPTKQARFRRQRHKARLIDDQQFLPRQVFLETHQPFLVSCFHQLVYQRCGRGEAYPQAPLARRQRPARCGSSRSPSCLTPARSPVARSTRSAPVPPPASCSMRGSPDSRTSPGSSRLETSPLPRTHVPPIPQRPLPIRSRRRRITPRA